MNNWQPFSKLVRGMSCMSYLCFFCLHWITCQSIPTFTQAWSYLLLKIFHTTCFLLSVYLYDWSNPNMSLTHLTRTIRTISGDYMWQWETKRSKIGAMNYWGRDKLERDLRPLFIHDTTRRSAGLRDPTLLWGSLWPSYHT